MIRNIRFTLPLGVILLCACYGVHAAEPPRALPPLDKDDPSQVRWHLLSVASARKLCSVVHPVPEAAQHWTHCQSGEYSRCGGPADCRCADQDDKLVWYHCQEGDYARCEDDANCKEGDSD